MATVQCNTQCNASKSKECRIADLEVVLKKDRLLVLPLSPTRTTA
jgi:hypothetical protein